MKVVLFLKWTSIYPNLNFYIYARVISIILFGVKWKTMLQEEKSGGSYF